MATNYLQDGNEIEVEVSKVSAGDIVVSGGVVGVALIDTPQEVTGSLMCTVKTRGVFKLLSNTAGFNSAGLDVGDLLITDTDSIKKTTSVAGVRVVGVCLSKDNANSEFTIMLFGT